VKANKDKGLTSEDEKSLFSQEEIDDFLRRANFERERKLQTQNIDHDLQAANNRARSVSVGTAFGGAVDLTMRRPDGICTYAILQPVEAIELLHQLSAAVGCHLNLQPREDFSSWRDWNKAEPKKALDDKEDKEDKECEVEKLGHSTHPPHPMFLQENREKASKMPAPEEQPGLDPSTMAIDNA